MKRLLLLLMTLVLLALPVLAEETILTPEQAGLTAKGYVLITAGTQGQYQWYPLPEEEPYEVTIHLKDMDGNEYENVVAITPEGAYMLSSNCDNQDCVEEGIVTLENKELRILGSWIVCLPHQVTVELFSAQEVLELLMQEMNVAR